MAKSPRKIGIIISGGNPWEIVFCLYNLEKRGIQRQPITTSTKITSAAVHDYEQEISKVALLNLAEVKATGLEALIIPGGFKLFNSMCNFEQAGDSFKIDESLRNVIKGMYRLGKPVAGFGPAGLLIAKSIQGIVDSAPVITVGSDPRLQAGVEGTGAQAVLTRPGEVVLDQTNKLITSGGEHGASRLDAVADACSSLVQGIMELIKK